MVKFSKRKEDDAYQGPTAHSGVTFSSRAAVHAYADQLTSSE